MQSEATDVLMAVLGEHDALWDGELFPEILDAEEYDCTQDHYTVKLPDTLFAMIDPQIRDVYDRIDAIDCLMATVVALSEKYPCGLIPEDLDGMLFDHPVIIDGYDDVPDIDLDGQPL